jgi:hypothetical protein
MDELRNQVVMVQPNLPYDPLFMQGYMGIISHFNADQSAAYVKFQNQSLGLYSTDALWMLVPGFLVVDKLRSMDSDDIESHELVDLLDIYLMNGTGELKYQKEALDRATDNANIMYAAVITVEDYIESFLHNDRDINPAPGLRR